MVIGYIYTLLYIAELVLRLSAHGLRLFCSDDWMWVCPRRHYPQMSATLSLKQTLKAPTPSHAARFSRTKPACFLHISLQ